MYVFEMPWGGSLALRGDLARHPRLREHWCRGFCEDTAAHRILRELGLRLEWVPQATQVNRESIPLRRCRAFILRQLPCVRLHHPRWPLIFGLNIGSILAQFGALALLAGALAAGAWELAGVALVLLGLYLFAMLATLRMGEELVRLAFANRGEKPPGLHLSW